MFLAWGITSVSEKQSPDGSFSAPPTGGVPDGVEPASATVVPLSERVALIEPRATTVGPTTEPARPAPPVADVEAPYVPRVAIPVSPPSVANRQPPSSRVWHVVGYFGRAVRYGAIAFVIWFVVVIGLIGLFRFVDPPMSMLMATKRLSGESLQADWVSLDAVSPNLRRAVITSEDGKFCRHWGFDLGEIRAAMQAGDGFGRGASTITQQLAKNLFLWPGKSYVRKALEVPLTFAIEGMWPKWRILEVYLNVAEWGPGVFGAEAASQYHFGKAAAKVSEREAALLAVALPNPIARDAGDPEPRIARRASTIQARMRAAGSSASFCVINGPSKRSFQP